MNRLRIKKDKNFKKPSRSKKLWMRLQRRSKKKKKQ
jgi:hypothetical protein